MAEDNTIILKLQVQEAQAKVNIKNIEKAIDKLDGRTKEYRLAVAKLNAEEQKLINTRKQLVKASSDLSKSSETLIGNNKQGLNGVSKASGGATAAAMELGRVVSDAPYGIRGMANNISQLASQLFYMAGQQVTATTATTANTVATNVNTVANKSNTSSKVRNSVATEAEVIATNSDTAAKTANTAVTTGAAVATTAATGATVGFIGAVKLMWSALMGPMGVLLAIQAVIAGLDYFYGTQKKSEKAIKNTTDALAEQRKELSALTEEYSEHDKLKEKTIMLNSKETEMLKALNKEVINSTNTDKRRRQALKELTKLYPKYFKGLKIDDVNSLIKAEESVNRILTNKIKLKENLIRAEKIANEIQLEKLRLEKIEREGGGKPKDTPKLMALYEEQKVVRDLLGIYAALDLSVGKSKDKEVTAGKIIDPKSFEADLFEIEKMLNNFRLEDVKNSAKTEQEKAAAKSLIELDKFTSNYYEYVNSEAKKFDKFKENLDKQLKAKKISEDSYNSALSTAEEERRKGQKSSYENFLIGLKAISDKYSPDIIGEGITVTTTLAEQAKKDAKIKLDGQLDAFLEYAKSAKIALTEISSFLQAESDRELTIEQNKTNALNQELNNRLLNENLSKDQRASIQNQIAINDEKLRKKQNKIKEKAFKTQKAFNIALAVTDTITAGIGAARATYGGPIAKIAAMTATIGAGMLQVAMIARQKFQPDAANTPVNVGSSSAGGGSARAEPSFNIVGRSNDNILMSAIQSQFDQPLRAYVVARDVTNQQQLDGVISGAAST